MDLIVTHNNADFDAFSSLVAAKKLYPNARLLLPGSEERAVREFLSLARDEICIEKERTCDLSDIRRLIIVDTRHKSRIGIAAKLLTDKSIEIHIYDHHPRTRFDIKADKDIFQEVGATVSIITDMLRRRRSVKFTALEATLMLLAIYEETGSLTYRTTTRLDVDMVSFLFSKGANLEAISSYLNRELTGGELTFLTSLISSTEVVAVNGVNVAIAEGTIKGFIGELGTIVRKLQDLENFPVLFAMFKIREKLRVIARSRLKEVDVNRILKRFGGGGHRSAASAKLEGSDFETFKKKLINILKSSIKIKVFAGEIMNRPVKVIPAQARITDAERILKRLRLKGAPVRLGRRLVGMITTGDIRKARKHHYGRASVKGYMSSPLITAKSDTPLHAVQKLMFEKKIGRLPVMKNGKLAGIITRTDVLKSVHKDIFKKPSPLKGKRTRFNISRRMKKLLPKPIMGMLHTIGRCAGREGYRAFVVGGFVRDVLLNAKNFDLDIVIEGDAIAFGRSLARLYKGTFVSYEKFGTSQVFIKWPGKHKLPFKIDLASARKESYEKPAALPTVEFSSIRNDLQRRDFTINAMAVSLNKGSFGQLVDFFGGEKDLKNGVIRALHDGSFIDDPTRIFRAVRFEQRLGFRIDAYTERLIRYAAGKGMFFKTQNQRIREELMLMLEEEEPIRAILRMEKLHELRFIHKKILVTGSIRGIFARIKSLFMQHEKDIIAEKRPKLSLVYLMALFQNLKQNEVKCVCEKFVFTRRDRIKLLSYKKNSRIALKSLRVRRLSPAGIYRVLEGLSTEETLFTASRAKGSLVTSRIGDFFRKYAKIKIKIGGNDLKKLGVPPGPLYSKLLAEVLHRKIDGKIKTKKDELKFIIRRI